MFHCITSSFNRRFPEWDLNSFLETFLPVTVNMFFKIILFHKVKCVWFLFTCIGLNHIKRYTRFLLEYLRRVFDLHIYKIFRATCNEVAMGSGTVATVNTFNVSGASVTGKRYHYCIFSEGTARQRGFFSHSTP